jgi:hypothetical protein
MKKRKDMDWELFELLEGELSAKEESEILDIISSDDQISSEWDFMQMTQLSTPDISYSRKQQLVKKDTGLVAFSSFQWRRVISVAAVLALCFPLWKLILKSTDSAENMIGSANEIITPKSSNEIDSRPNLGDHPLTASASLEGPTQSKTERIPYQMRPKIEPTKPTDDERKAELVSILPARIITDIQAQNEALPNLPKARVRYNMASLLPLDEDRKSFKGIRPTFDAGLAKISSPFRDSRLRLQPSEKNTITILYSSNQYHASAMVSLKPLK